MPLRRPFESMHPEFDQFLFATVGEEVDGIPLSVLSALSRLGLDPRDEAARLSDLAGDAAADQLARTIARLPGGRWTSLEMRNIADRLVALLPRARKSGKNDPVTGGADRKATSWTPGLLICLMLAGAVIVSLAASGTLSLGGKETRQPASGADSQTSYRPAR